MSDISLSYVTGATPVARLYTNGAYIGVEIALAEIGAIGEYEGNLPSGVAAGTYLVVFFDSGTKLVSGELIWDGTKEVTIVTIEDQIDALPTAAENATAVLTSAVETGATVVESLRLHNSVLGGKVSGAGSGVESFRDLADSKNRLISTVDANGNRTTEVPDLT